MNEWKKKGGTLVELKDKWLTGLVKTFSQVDSTLTKQGFKRSGKWDQRTYQLIIQDSATSSTYALSIPTRIEQVDGTHENMTIRFGKPLLKKKFSMSQPAPSSGIPVSIRHAVESKLAEIADYLHSYKT